MTTSHAAPLTRSGPRRVRMALTTALIAGAACALLVAGPPPSARGETQPSPGAQLVTSYALSASWNEQQWQARPGHYAETGDISTLPDGRIFILDRRLNALHELDAGGRPLDLWLNPDQQADADSTWRWQRLDAGADGRLHVLSRAETGGAAGTPRVVSWQLDHLDGSGRRVGAIDLGTISPQRYVDVAARADGRLYLVRTDGNVASRGDISYGIDIFSATGEKLETLTPPQFTIPLTLDLAPDGSLYVVDQFPHTGQTPAPGKVDGVAVFGPDHVYQRTIRFSGASDVSAGAGGAVYVSRNNELYQVAPGEPRLLFSGPTIQKNPYALASLGRPEMFSVDLRPDGRLVASLSHCSFQGLVALGAEGSGTPAGLSGELDIPQLRGPIHPWRIAASGDRTAILQARYEPAPPDLAGSLGAPYLLQRYTSDAQTLLEYQGDRLTGQVGACGVWNQPWGVKDIAMDGEDQWTIDAQALRLRQGTGPEPERVFALSLLDDPLASPQLTAVSAQGGRAALLDHGSGAVILVSRDLTRIGAPLPVPGPMATDLALFGQHVALAQGRQVLLMDLDGTVAPRHLTAPGPVAAVAYGPAGELLALTADGWLARYGAGLAAGTESDAPSPAGPETLWRVPDDRAQPRDLTVDGRGRALVTWADNAPYGTPGGGIDATGAMLIKAGGVWVFEPRTAAGSLMAPPGAWAGGCVLAGRKQVQPNAVRAGGTVTVTLSVEGRCPAARQPLDLVVVLDVAKSMANDYGLDRARAALLDLLPRLAAHDVRVALVAAGSEGGLLHRLLPPDADLGRRLAELAPAGDRRLADGLFLAAGALTADGLPGRRKAVLVLTDGATPAATDDLSPMLAGLGTLDAAVRVWLHPGRFISAAELQALETLFGKDAVTALEGPESAAALADGLTAAKPFSGNLAATLAVTDGSAPGTTLVEGSSQPAAIVDPAGGKLRWELTALPSDRVTRLSYRLRADALGSRVPVDRLSATAAYTDGLGLAGGFPFPRPLLRVRGAGEALLPWMGR